MKKILTVLLALMMVLIMTGCEKEKTENEIAIESLNAEDVDMSEYGVSNSDYFKKVTPEKLFEMMNVKEGESLYSNYSDSWKKCPWNEPSCTVKENHGAVNIHPKLPRVITAREMARLQSFPDDFIFQGSKKWQLVQIGNAVPCYLGKAIGLSVEKMLKEKGKN